MHILLIHQAFASLDEPGGTRHYEMARYLVRKGHRVTIIASPVSYITGKARGGKTPFIARETPEPGIEILRTYVYPAHHKSFVHRMIAFFSFMFSSFFAGLGVREVDAVWGTSPPIFQGWTAMQLARLKRAPFFFEVRDLWPYFAVAVGVLKNRTLIRMSEWLERTLYRHAEIVLVNSPGFLAHVRERGARETALIPNGVDTKMFAGAEGRAFREAHHLEDAFVVLYAGAHGLSNDLDVALDAAKEMQDSRVKFVFLGDGKEKPRLQARAAEENIANALFIPSIPKEQMPAALAAADACLAILKPIEAYKTTYPNKVFDYMAAGKPVLLLIDGVIRQVVEEAGAGVFVPPGDASALAAAARALAADPDAARIMGERGRAYVQERFDRESIAAAFESLLRERVQEKSKTRRES